LESLDELTKGQKSKIENDLEMLHLSRRLAEINCQAPLQCLLEDALLVVNEAKVFAMIQEIELRNVQNLVKNILVIREAI
jgi:5'-3' exonuclease